MTASSLAFALTRRALMVALPASFFPLPGLGKEARPAHWAAPVASALPNLHRVTPLLYRAAQPDGAGFEAAAALGIRTVINLRQTVRDQSLTANPALTLIRVPMKARHVAEREGAQVVAALQALRQAKGPVLVHCHHGADRTGVICALYRMLYQGWSRDEAISELTLGGFGYHPVWANIPRYLAEVDIARLRDRIEA